VFRDIDDTAYIRYLFVSEPEDHESYEVSLIRMHRFHPGDELTDPDHDVSDETFQLACREYRDNGGRLVRQVFYDPMDPENILDMDVTRIHLYRYDELGRLSGSTMFSFSGEFDGDFSNLDRDHEACRQEYRVFYDSVGNLRYWIITLVSSIDEDESTLIAFTWEVAPGVRGQAADFLRSRVRWIDTHPDDVTGELGLMHVLFPVVRN
jgi:hypothetical protein